MGGVGIKGTKGRTNMEATNIYDPIKNAKGKFLPDPQLQQLNVISPIISDQVHKDQIVSNFDLVSRSLRCISHYTVHQVEFGCHASYTAGNINLIRLDLREVVIYMGWPRSLRQEYPQPGEI